MQPPSILENGICGTYSFFADIIKRSLDLAVLPLETTVLKPSEGTVYVMTGSLFQKQNLY